MLCSFLYCLCEGERVRRWCWRRDDVRARLFVCVCVSSLVAGETERTKSQQTARHIRRTGGRAVPDVCQKTSGVRTGSREVRTVTCRRRKVYVYYIHHVYTKLYAYLSPLSMVCKNGTQRGMRRDVCTPTKCEFKRTRYLYSINICITYEFLHSMARRLHIRWTRRRYATKFSSIIEHFHGFIEDSLKLPVRNLDKTINN